MPEIELSAGTIEYEDSGPPPGGSGAASGRGDASAGDVAFGRADAPGGGEVPTVVLLHGLLMNATVWREVAPALAAHCRVIAPTLPLGGHRRAMRADADLSLPAMVRLLTELLEALDLRDVVLVSNDWGGALLLGDVPGGLDRVGRLAITPSEAFDNFPPGINGRLAQLAGKGGPLGVKLALQPLALRPLRRFPLLFGWMSKRPLPHALTDGWFAPILHDHAIRRDLAKYAGGPLDRAWTARATERLRAFDRPALVLWAREDKLMPRDHGRRLAELLPHARLVEVDDSRTLMQLDRPQLVREELLAFATATTPAAAPAATPEEPADAARA
ncbi:alpha/beta fold hydrolase [Conexibacter sp. JD483]|uniref:alpha/beta fold hydrolase n=1 Tax=unclassified Conexibacter TaxID=2627773 RepID=UPI00272909B2|nr:MULTISPECIES: alpha/beta fold hydrolase [unclassified Conexibacter]MDO8185235.1 alpha/beta fold hydrolase [Conexibacter sp. CPCC 205706]MDO8198281.1 alpha/beta fold hydrolase [Conexibacter sp. CPCC 205762]MDR9367757.1 alpha/beta fold hydrolase [Conexibacter sp. JD483]